MYGNVTVLNVPFGGGNAPIRPGSDTMRRFSSFMKAVVGTIVIMALIALLIVISASIADSHASESHDVMQTETVL